MGGRDDYSHALPGYSLNLGVTVVKLIDGFLGQVAFGGEIVYQTDLMPFDEHGSEKAIKAAQIATIEAVKRLFAQ